MWTIPVVVDDELAEDQRQVVFIQHDKVVQALAPQRPDAEDAEWGVAY